MTISSNEFDSREAESGTATAAAPVEPETHASDADVVPRKREKVRRSTSHWKAVPETLAHRETFKVEAERYDRSFDKSQPFSKDELEDHSRKLLAELDEPE